VDAPQDAEIARLGLALNKTYLPYGALGSSGQSRQEAQDQNAAAAGKGSATSRAVSKAGRLYANSTWDLVDAVLQREVDLGAVKSEDLPETMRTLSPAERQAYVEAASRERKALQAQIAALNLQRERFVAERQKRASAADSLDSVMAKTLRAQAGQKGLEVE
jgi:hypothetical protein